MKRELEALANRVVNSLQKKNLLARTVTIKVRFGDFTTVTRSHSAEPTRAASAPTGWKRPNPAARNSFYWSSMTAFYRLS